MRNFLEGYSRSLCFHVVVQCVEKFIKYPYWGIADTLLDWSYSYWLWLQSVICLISLLWFETLVWYLSGFLTTDITVSRLYNLGTVTVCNFLNLCLQDVLCLNPNITLIFLFCSVSALCRWAAKKLFQITTMTGSVQNILPLMSLESDNNINPSSSCMLYWVSSIIFSWSIHDKLISKWVPKKLVDSVRVRFWLSSVIFRVGVVVLVHDKLIANVLFFFKTSWFIWNHSEMTWRVTFTQ